MTKDMLSYCKRLVEEIKALVYLQPEKRDIDSLTEMERIQVRAADDPEHTKNISNRITDEGSTDDCDPVVANEIEHHYELLQEYDAVFYDFFTPGKSIGTEFFSMSKKAIIEGLQTIKKQDDYLLKKIF